LRDKERGRTVRVRQLDTKPTRYLVEDQRGKGPARTREHASLGDAVRDLAATWRQRLH